MLSRFPLFFLGNLLETSRMFAYLFPSNLPVPNRSIEKRWSKNSPKAGFFRPKWIPKRTLELTNEELHPKKNHSDLTFVVYADMLLISILLHWDIPPCCITGSSFAQERRQAWWLRLHNSEGGMNFNQTLPACCPADTSMDSWSSHMSWPTFPTAPWPVQTMARLQPDGWTAQLTKMFL